MSDDLSKTIQYQMQEPARFISAFLEETNKSSTMKAIYESLRQREIMGNEIKTEQRAKRMKVIEDNFDELMANPLHTIFNKEDYLKTAFLQYMIYAYEAKVVFMRIML